MNVLYNLVVQNSMTKITITDFRNRLRYYIDRVRNGERFIITIRGKSVAIITPPSKEKP